LLKECKDNLSNIRSVHLISTRTEKTDNSEIIFPSESYIIIPDIKHIIYQAKGIGPMDVIEEWRFGEDKYVHYGDGRITISEVKESYIFTEIIALESAVEPISLEDEEIDELARYSVEAKMPHDLKDIANGYNLVKLYIDKQELLLRKLVLELEPIRYRDKIPETNDQKWAESEYIEYNQAFQIDRPEVTK